MSVLVTSSTFVKLVHAAMCHADINIKKDEIILSYLQIRLSDLILYVYRLPHKVAPASRSQVAVLDV